MPRFDYTDHRWLDDSHQFMTSSSSHPLNTHAHNKTRERLPKPHLSLVEWFIIGPMVVGLGFMAGVMWP